MEANRETPESLDEILARINEGLGPLNRRFHAQLTFPGGARVDAILASVLRELRENERKGLEVYLDSQTPDSGSVYITGPATPVNQSMASLLGIFGIKVKEATRDQVDRLSAALIGPIPELWDKDAKPMTSGPVASEPKVSRSKARHGAAASSPEAPSPETP